MLDHGGGVGLERELVAILKADVAGYSRMMQADEVFTVRTLTEFRQAMAGMVADRRGQVVHTAGDSFLAKFPSVADAVECALEVQDEIGARNAAFPEDRQVRFRIGLNLGDVIHEGGDIHGDGVNIAARIEALAVPGGICVSAPIYDQTRYKAGLSYEDLGEHAVKNIAAPVRAFRLRAQASPEPALAKVAAAVPWGSYVICTKRGGWVLPRFTPSRPPRRSRSMSVSVHTVHSSPASTAAAAAFWAKAGGVREPPGSLTRSRARQTPCAVAEPRRRWALAASEEQPRTLTRFNLVAPSDPFGPPATDLKAVYR